MARPSWVVSSARSSASYRGSANASRKRCSDTLGSSKFHNRSRVFWSSMVLSWSVFTGGELTCTFNVSGSHEALHTAGQRAAGSVKPVGRPAERRDADKHPALGVDLGHERLLTPHRMARQGAVTESRGLRSAAGRGTVHPHHLTGCVEAER